MADVSFEIATSDHELVQQIARKAAGIYAKHGVRRPALEIEMDLIATHANGCPMDFERLAGADDFNLMHDVGGIAQHIDRRSGALTMCFCPRFAAKVIEAA